MFSLLSSAVKLAWLITSYSTILIHLARMSGFITGVLFKLFDTGIPYEVSMVLWSTVSTLNWIFHPRIVELAMFIWLALPAVRLTLYITRKFVWIA